MHANGSTHDPRTGPVPSSILAANRANALDLTKARIGGYHDPAHAPDYFHCPTLMEYVVDFLDRYNSSPCGQQ